MTKTLTRTQANRAAAAYLLLQQASETIRPVLLQPSRNGRTLPALDLTVPAADPAALSAAAAAVCACVYDGDNRAAAWVQARLVAGENERVLAGYELALIWLSLLRQAAHTAAGRKPLTERTIEQVRLRIADLLAT